MLGDSPDSRARAAGRRFGIEVTGRARQFKRADFERFDYVLAMDRSNFEDLCELSPSDAARAKVQLLRSFDPASARGASVPDPYYGDDDDFDEVVRICLAACTPLLEQLKREHRLGADMIDARLEKSLRFALGSGVKNVKRLSGGDINDAYQLELASGSRVFLKTNSSAPPGMFPAEARGLDWLRAAGALRVPEVLAVSSGREDEPSFLVLELLTPAAASSATSTSCSVAVWRSCIASGRRASDSTTTTSSARCRSATRRTRPGPSFSGKSGSSRSWRARSAAGQATGRMRSGFERLASRLSKLVGPEEPPSRLHGDLWGGNLHVDDEGAPCLIDPAAYGGHREVDLAMMRLFGGFSESVFRAYQEVWPLSPGHAERIMLYQLYPLMVHVNLFGGGYADSVERGLARYV